MIPGRIALGVEGFVIVRGIQSSEEGGTKPDVNGSVRDSSISKHPKICTHSNILMILYKLCSIAAIRHFTPLLPRYYKCVAVLSCIRRPNVDATTIILHYHVTVLILSLSKYIRGMNTQLIDLAIIVENHGQQCTLCTKKMHHTRMGGLARRVFRNEVTSTNFSHYLTCTAQRKGGVGRVTFG